MTGAAGGAVTEFARASTIAPAGDGRFTWEVPDGWQTGKGAFGGLVLGALTRAMQASEPDPARTVRVVSGELCGPMLVGATTIDVAVLRRGRAVTYLEARARQGGDEVVARATAILGGGRGPLTAVPPAAPPALPDPSTMPLAPMGQPPTPRFTSHYAYRLATPPPFAGGATGEALGWIAERTPPPRLDAAAVIGLLDAWWPVALIGEHPPRAMATISFTAQLLVDPATVDATAPLAYRATLIGTGAGYSVEVRELWQGGVLVALNPQTFAASPPATGA